MVEKIIILSLEKASGETGITVDIPVNEAFGDYSTNIALEIFSKKKGEHQSAREVAEGIVNKLKKDEKLSSVVEKVEVAGPGFINFWLSKDILFDNLIEIVSKKESYGKSDIGKGERVIFEFGQPNTHKLPHIGHLFSYVYGDATARIMEFVGYKLRRANYQGDIGLHVAKCLWAYKKNNPSIPESLEGKVKLLQDLYQEGSKAYEEDEEAKREINEVNQKIYNHDPEIEKLWRKTRSWSVKYYEDFEKKIGITFDRSYFESEVYEKGAEIVKENIGGVFKKSEGAIIFEGSKYNLHDRVFLNKDLNPTYEAKDMALAHLKVEEWSADKLIITTASEQNDYFKVMIEALKRINPVLGKKIIHIGFGMVDLKEGKMSSRTGVFIGAIELVERVIEEINTILSSREELNDNEKGEIAEIVGIASVKYSFLKNNPLQDVKFDVKESISKEGNSAPYLQYTYARCSSVLKKAEEPLNTPKLKDIGPNNEEVLLLRTLSQFQGVCIAAAKSYSPNLICNYLFDLAQKYNNFYNKHRIINPESGKEKDRDFKLALTEGVGVVIKTGLNLLGVSTLERM